MRNAMTTSTSEGGGARALELEFENPRASLRDLRSLPLPRRVLLADPAEFDVAYAINPHMLGESGELKRVDRELARAQWNALKSAFEASGLEVHVASALTGHPDLVFCANQALPIPRGASVLGRPLALASNMRWAQRRGEVGHVLGALGRLGYAPRRLATLAPLEGMGDGLWHPGRALLWAGVGPRSTLAAWDAVARWIDAPVAHLELIDPDFYHLDTALALLDERTCLWHPDALSRRSRRLVERLIPRCIEADPGEARTLLACNACSPDGRRVLIQRGCEVTGGRLRAAGYEVLELETSEFLKSGGSVFCMKLLVW
jgi:N-dimethylarginine dimethylaminohydrolase